MDSDSFKAWRKSLGLKQKDAADQLGLKKRVIQYYEKGHRDGKRIEIPRTVELACVALSLGYEGYGDALAKNAIPPPPNPVSGAEAPEPSRT